MGLMYIFPVDDKNTEDDRVVIKDSSITLKTYGLPMIFWGYLAAAVAVLFVMWLASRDIIKKLLSYSEDPSLIFLGHLVQWTLYLTPLILLGFFFYEKIIIKKNHDLTIIHRLFFLTIWKKKYHLNDKDSFSVEHFMASPNLARLQNKEGFSDAAMKAFENKGYFELIIKTNNMNEISIDRHSRKADLIKIKELLSRY